MAKDNASVVKSFEEKVSGFAFSHGLLADGGKYLVALSGGADSVSLLRVMKQIAAGREITIEATHCNFRLRGKESDRDEEFCKRLCADVHVPLHLVHFETKEYASLHHVSIEMAARELRYRYFEQLRQDIGADDICVAHHQDDCVETLLLNLSRGTGIRGLRGIQPRNVHVVRPMLCVCRNEILDYLAAIRQEYVTDSSNLVNDVKRNKIRLDVIPVLRTLNPSVSQAIFETTLNVSEACDVYDAAIEQSIREVVYQSVDGKCRNSTSCIDTSRTAFVSLEALCRQPSAESVLFHILERFGFSPSVVPQVYSIVCRQVNKANVKADMSVQGKVFMSSTHELLFDRGRIVVQPKDYGVLERPLCMPEPGVYVIDGKSKISVKEECVDENFTVSRENSCVCLDASKVKYPLTLRLVKNGERFVPFGMNSSKLISDYLTDCKITLFDKKRQLVLVDADDNVAWLVTRRTDNRCRIDKNSRTALRITFFNDIK